MIEDRTPQLDAVHRRVFPHHATNGVSHEGGERSERNGTEPNLTDDQIIDLARSARNGGKFQQLWAGNTAGYPSASEADAALCAMLAFYSRDPQQIEHLVSQSALNRDKWASRSDYRRRTVQGALALTTEHYGSHQVNVIHFQDSSTGVKSAISVKRPSRSSVAESWPDPPVPEAFAGLSGRFVYQAEKYTEADRVAVLASFLAAFGCAVGKGPHALVGATRHDARIFPVIVGETSKARKGDSWNPVKALFSWSDADFAAYRIQNGLASGEGLINAVRDANSDSDPGISDKRLLVVEPELARLLAVMGREGNTLSALVRDVWDGGTLQSMTKNNPLKATGAHISILGHITATELREKLTDTSAVNGFANRFIYLAVRRSKLLPEPEAFTSEDEAVQGLIGELISLLSWARGLGVMKRDQAAKELWREIYEDLSAEWDGLVGSILARAEAQVLRLSLLYALLDQSEVVRVPHLRSALALWQYSERSADYIFGDATGDQVADNILSSLKQRGRMTRTEIYNLSGRHVSSARIGMALDLLASKGLARYSTVDTGGRPTEVWEPVEVGPQV